MSDPFPRERILEELRSIKDASQELHRRIETLIGQIDGEPTSDPRIVEIARRAIAELRAKQRQKSTLPALGQPSAYRPRRKTAPGG